MTTIVNKTTIVPGTGTGPSYADYRLSGDIAVFRETAPTAQPAFLTFGRTEPKPTKDYAGVGRSSIKLTRNYADAQSVLRPAVFSVATSLPETMSQAQRDAFIVEGLLVLLDAVSQSNLKTRTVPQS